MRQGKRKRGPRARVAQAPRPAPGGLRGPAPNFLPSSWWVWVSPRGPALWSSYYLGGISLPGHHLLDKPPHFYFFFFEGKWACCLPSSYVFTLPLFLPFFPLFSCHLCSLWKAGAAAWEPDRRAQRKQQLPSLAQQAEIPDTNPKSRVSNTLQCYKKHEEFTCSCSRTFFWQLDQATRLV